MIYSDVSNSWNYVQPKTKAIRSMANLVEHSEVVVNLVADNQNLISPPMSKQVSILILREQIKSFESVELCYLSFPLSKISHMRALYWNY